MYNSVNESFESILYWNDSSDSIQVQQTSREGSLQCSLFPHTQVLQNSPVQVVSRSFGRTSGRCGGVLRQFGEPENRRLFGRGRFCPRPLGRRNCRGIWQNRHVDVSGLATIKWCFKGTKELAERELAARTAVKCSKHPRYFAVVLQPVQWIPAQEVTSYKRILPCI